MNAKIITYDLCQPGRNYQQLIERIQQFSKSCHICESAWLIYTDWNSKQIICELGKYIDQNDRIFVAELNKKAAWHNVLSNSDVIKTFF